MNKEEYALKLKSYKWKQRRIEILKRDMCVCADCYEASEHNHVHHLYYEKGKDPWEYPDSALITLCDLCHEKEHGIIYPDQQIVKVPHFLKKEGLRARDFYTLYPCLFSGITFDCSDKIVKQALRLRERRNINHQYQISCQRYDKDSPGNKLQGNTEDEGWI